MTTTALTHAATPLQRPALTAARRALIRIQVARTANRIIAELTARPEPRHGRTPTFARLDLLTERYAALGGDPTTLLR
jgi:hypothetical protein